MASAGTKFHFLGRLGSHGKKCQFWLKISLLFWVKIGQNCNSQIMYFVLLHKGLIIRDWVFSLSLAPSSCSTDKSFILSPFDMKNSQ